MTTASKRSSQPPQRTAKLPLRHLNGFLAGIDTQDPRSLADALAAIHEAAAASPVNIIQGYRRFTELELEEGADQRAEAIASGLIALDLALDDHGLLLDAGRWLRSIEEAALEHGGYLVSSWGPDLEDDWRTSDGRFFVIPRITARETATGKSFMRRALLRHRILDANPGGLTLRLHRSSAVSDRAQKAALVGSGSPYGAGLFPKLSAELSFPNDDEFLVADVGGYVADQCFDEHLQEGDRGGCKAIIWPELTMPTRNLVMLKEKLAARALDSLSSRLFYVAGSWHETENGYTHNICHILDGYGGTLFSIAKWAPFSMRLPGEPGLREEAIATGTEVSVLVGEDELTLVAVCRDFLDESVVNPYEVLAVDVAIIPSMMPHIGCPKTIEGHLATARTMQVRFETGTIVVAQPAVLGEDAKAPVGQILAYPNVNSAHDKGEYVMGAWHVCLLKSP